MEVVFRREQLLPVKQLLLLLLLLVFRHCCYRVCSVPIFLTLDVHGLWFLHAQELLSPSISPSPPFPAVAP